MDKFTKRGADGSVDIAASGNAYMKALAEWATQNETPTDKIEAAVEAVFDKFPTGRISVPSLVGFALTELGATPDQHKSLTNRVRAYVSGQCANNTGRLDIMKGVGGGVMRLSRPGEEIPARPAKKSA